MKMLTEQVAYAAMFAFLKMQFELTGSDELRLLLSCMSLLPGGEAADPALWDDWCSAIEATESGTVNVQMELRSLE
jgi:hypothetical protein